MKRTGLLWAHRLERKKKSSSIGQGGRGRKTKISMSTMNKRKNTHWQAFPYCITKSLTVSTVSLMYW